MELTRRRFFQALAASALVLGVPLPIGMPASAVKFVNPNWYMADADTWYHGVARAMQQTKQEVGASVFNKGWDKQ